MLREYAAWDDEPNTFRSGMITACRSRNAGFHPWPVLCWGRFITSSAFRAESVATAALLRHKIFSRWIFRFTRAS